MKKGTKKFWSIVTLVGVLVAAIGFIALIQSPLGIIIRGNPNAGEWEDAPENWYRAFGQAPPTGVSVVHSYYRETDHFTHEYIYYFEVDASPEWQQAFLNKRNLGLVPESNAWGARTGNGGEGIPNWFAPDPVEQYDVWDLPKYHGSVWIDKSNGHMYFYGASM